MDEVIISSDQDLHIYDDNNNFHIQAGPGAGKTHLIIENIRHIVEKSSKIKDFNKRKILCITYTNAAVDEINQRLGSLSKYTVVSTIHSFINEYIIKPFQKQLKLLIKADFSIEIHDKKRLSSVQEDFTILSGHNKEAIFQWINEKYPAISEELYKTLSRSSMEKVELDISNMNTYPFNRESNVAIKLSNKIQDELCQVIKEYIWSEANKLSFDEVLYFGLSLLQKYEFILHFIRAEFPYIFIDEYQDTNPIQNEILNIIQKHESSIIVVGDISQSIYSFQGATYLEFKNFKSANIEKSLTKMKIQDNRRSTKNIIKLLNYIRKDDKLEQECVKNKDNNFEIVFFIQKGETNFEKISEHIDEDTIILCRKWTEVFNYIRDVDSEQRKLINSIYNTYTFHYNRSISREIESKYEMWICCAKDIAELEEAFTKRNLSQALDVFGRYLDINTILSEFNDDKLIILQNIVDIWINMFKEDLSKKKLKDISIALNSKLSQISDVKILREFKYPEKGEDGYSEELYKHIDQLEYSCAKKIVLELFSEKAKFMTIHKAKGREFNSVLVNLEPFSRGNESKFNAVEIFTRPSIISESEKEYSEYTRIAYVGLSRAINKLYIHLKGDEETEKSIKNAINSFYSDNEEFFKFIYC